MASIALMGLLTGFAKGAKERAEREREENEELIKTRLKLASVAKQKRETETAARKTALTERYNTISPFLDGSESEVVKLALISNEAIAKDFVERKSRGESVDFDSYLVRNNDKIPTNFESVQKYIDTISAAPAPVAPEQMRAAFGEERGFLGARTGVSPGRAERIARTLGGGASASQLLAYEQAAPVAGEPLMDYARINTELYPKEIKKPEEQLEHLQGKVVQFTRQFGENDERTQKAKQELAVTQAAIETLSEPQQNWSKRRNQLVAIIAGTATPGEKARAEVELRRGDAIDKNQLSPGDLFKFAQTAGSTAVSKKFGSEVGKNIAIVPTQEGGSTYQYIGAPSDELRRQVEATYESAVRAIFNRYVDPVTQQPINDAYRSVMDALLPRVTPAAPVETPAAAPPVRVSSTASAVPSTAPTAAPARSTGLGARPAPAQPSVNVAEARRNAQQAIAQGANAEAVKKRFKELTGQDY